MLCQLMFILFFFLFGSVFLFNFCFRVSSFLLAPIGWVLFQSSLSRLAVYNSTLRVSKLLTHILLVLVIIGLIVVGWIIFIEWYGIAVLTLDQSRQHDATMVQSIYLLLACLSYAVILICALVRLLFIYVMEDDGVEIAPLLDDYQSNLQVLTRKLSFEIASYNDYTGSKSKDVS